MFLLHEYEPFMSSFVKCFVLRFSSFDLFKIWILSFYLKKCFGNGKCMISKINKFLDFYLNNQNSFTEFN